MNTTPRTDMNKADKGFTLIEVLMALALFSIGILAVASLQVTASLQSRNSSEIAEASASAHSQMEALMIRPLAHTDLNAGTHTLTSGVYSIQWTVTASNLNADLIDESKNVVLTVNKTGSTKHPVTFSFIHHN
jgi:type IV pilus assembly protein PilV